MQDLAKQLDTNDDLVLNVAKRSAIADEIFKTYARYLDDETEKYLRQAFIHQPDALTSVANSLVARSGLSGKWGENVAAAIITPSNLDLAMKELDIVFNVIGNYIDVTSLATREQTLVHFEQFTKKFVGNKFKVNDKTILNPADIFFKYKGLDPDIVDPKNGQGMLTLAIDAAMKKVGFESTEYGNWKVVNQELVDEFLGDAANTVALRERNLIDSQIAEIQLARLFMICITPFMVDQITLIRHLWMLYNVVVTI
jgi:hypothetical protein